MYTTDRDIAVAVSGGVDSSVAAHLLLQSGYAVHGVFITIRAPDHLPCTSSHDRQEAMRACASLGIPFLEYDATDAYHRLVLDPFIEAYRRGETPNPDVLCNRQIKFGVLLSFLRRRGFSRYATGHYARVVVDSRDSARLARARDEDKDQTYFIYELPSCDLATIMFPVGEYTKQQVRDIAARAHLPAAEKKESAGLCFLGSINLHDFLSAYMPLVSGPVMLGDRLIGEHEGAAGYTIGQRHGFQTTEPGPFVVTGKDMACNTLFVSPLSDFHPPTSVFTLRDVVFRESCSGSVFARYRHRGSLHPVAVKHSGESATVSFSDPQTIASGQSIVCYTSDGVCIGGGIVL